MARLSAYERRQVESYGKQRKAEGKATSASMGAMLGGGAGTAAGAGAGIAAGLMAGGAATTATGIGAPVGLLLMAGGAGLGALLGGGGGLLFGGKKAEKEAKAQAKKDLLYQKKMEKKAAKEEANIQWREGKAAEASGAIEKAAATRAAKPGGVTHGRSNVVLSEGMAGVGGAASGGGSGWDTMKARKGWSGTA